VNASCTGPELACNDNAGVSQSEVVLNLLGGQDYIVTVDAFSAGTPLNGGNVVLNVAEGTPEVCDNVNDDDLDGASDCFDADCIGDAACCPSGGAIGLGVTTGNLIGEPSQIEPSCSGQGGPELTYEFTAPANGEYRFDVAGSAVDVVVSLLDGCGGNEIACESGGLGQLPILAANLVGGTTYLVSIDARSGTTNLNTGDIRLDVVQVTPEVCNDGIDNDFDGFDDCTDTDCFGDPNCIGENCGDNTDNDADTLIDCDDPDCATDPICVGEVVCNDGLDDDSDLRIDCFDDDCIASPDCCANKPTNGPGLYSTTTFGLPDVYPEPSCGLFGGTSSEVTFEFTAPNTADYVFTSGGPTTHNIFILDGCGGTELACDNPFFPDPNIIELSMTAGQTVIVVLDTAATFFVPGPVDLLIFEIGPEICNDGIDNDLDFNIDCFDVDCTNDPICGPEVCDDGVDNDADFFFDCDDADCAADPQCCPKDSIPGPGTYSSDTTGETSSSNPVCVFNTGVPDTSFEFTPNVTANYLIDTVGSGFDTVLSVEDGCGGPVLACNDDTFGPQSEVEVRLEAGVTYVIQVDGFGFGDIGAVVLNVAQLPPEICGDNIDNDNDFLVDCFDPDCGNDVNCFEDCQNGVDDDGDGPIDCADSFCNADPACCPSFSTNTVPFSFAGDLTGQPNNHESTCSSASVGGISGNDFAVEFTAPAQGEYLFTVGASDPTDVIISIKDSCGGSELDCDDTFFDGVITRNMLAGETVLVIADAWSGANNGPFQLDIDLVVPFERDCFDGLNNDGDNLADCADTDCFYVPGCFEQDCDNLIDDDSDGLLDCLDDDCEFDVTCIEICDNGFDDDNDQLIDCADEECVFSPLCFEICDNGFDDDGDGLADCLDAACATAPNCCPSGGQVNTVPFQATGDLLNEPDLHESSCSSAGFGGIDGNDFTVEFTAPADGDYLFTTGGSDPTDVIISLKDSCGGAELDCNDLFFNSLITRSMVSGETVLVIADGWDNVNGNGPFQLDIVELQTEEIDCGDGIDEDADFAPDCADPDCNGDPACIEVDCADGLDNDGDGLPDCFDPDCSVTAACAELDCANGLDDDNDGGIDCGDPDCDLAPGCIEDCTNLFDDDFDGFADCNDGFCASDPTCCPRQTVVTAPTTIVGDLLTENDVFDATCSGLAFGGTDGNDFSVEFTAPADGRYVVRTGDSESFLIVGFRESCGGAELQCGTFFRW
ncbi:MAG: hypothetical protein AAF211_13740, partial [Myxococcota bacterium]